MDIKELPTEFIGKGEVAGFRFNQIYKSDRAYVYSVQEYGKTWYEVIKRRVNKRFNTESYPKGESFGRFGKCVMSYDKAVSYAKEWEESN